MLLTNIFLAACLVGEAACTSGDQSCAAKLGVSASSSEDVAVELLQRNAGNAKKVAQPAVPADFQHTYQDEEPPIKVLNVNTSKVWSELRAAVNVDNLKSQLQKAKEQGSDTVNQLQAQLEELQQQFPSTEEVKQHFSAQWDNISKAIDFEECQEQLNEAVARGSDQVKQLQEQLDSLKAQLPQATDVVASIQDQATETWSYLQDQGVSLPNLNDLSDQAEALAKQAGKSISGLWDANKDQLNNIANSVGNSVSDLANQAGNVANSVGDALGGLFR